MNRTTMMMVACVAVAAVSLAAQAHPDFSGTWVLDAAKTAEARARSGAPGPARGGGAGGAMGGGGGGSMSGGGGGGGFNAAGGGAGRAPLELHLTQTATGLTIERSGAVPQKFVHSFDGKSNANVNGRITQTTTSRWDGRRLVTEGTTAFKSDDGEMKSELKEIRSLDAAGNLVVESSRTVEGSTTTSVQVFTKK